MYFALLQNPEDKFLFEVFYNKFYNTVYFIAKDHLHTKEDAEDCAHEVFMIFAKEFHNISRDFDDKKLCNYIRVVSKCKAIDMYRHERKHINNVVDIDISDFCNVSIEEFDVFDEIQIRDAFNKMPEEYKYICYLKYVYNMSGAEISQKLNISQPLVRKRCMLGKLFIKNYLMGDDE